MAKSAAILFLGLGGLICLSFITIHPLAKTGAFTQPTVITYSHG
jgi:hypothetical protein